MKIQSYNHFKLLKSDLPEITKNKVITDVDVGGIKLVYQVTIRQCLTFLFFDKLIIIPLPSLHISSIQKVFLKPYKEYYSRIKENKNLPKSLWGKNNDPLTALWVEMEFDYESVKPGKSIIEDKKEIRDTNITKHLNKIEKSFFIKSKNNQFV
jgi:hypothetical protein